MIIAARSMIALLVIGVWLVLGGVYQRVTVWPAYHLFSRRRRRIVSAYMRGMSRVIFGVLEVLGGARFERRGCVPTKEPALILMNHQSLLDIITVVMLGDPYVPAFVSRDLYGRGIPAVSLCLRLLGCPLIKPRKNPRRAAEIVASAASAQPHGLVIFPEGHRSTSGEIRPFRAAGTEAALRRRPLPVYLVVTDGFTVARRLIDFVTGVGRLRGRTEVLGPYHPPTDPRELRPFIHGLRTRMIERLDRMRRGERGDVTN